MYKNNFVAAVKCRGKILREREGAVYLPFGSEYSLYLKNLENRKVSVEIFIDGKSIFGNRSYVLGANGEGEIERFVENLNKGNRFKFIKKTSEIIDHRGDLIDDGLIRIKFTFEKQLSEHHEYHIHHHDDYFYPIHPVYPRYEWVTRTGGWVNEPSKTISNHTFNSGVIGEDYNNIDRSSLGSKGGDFVQNSTVFEVSNVVPVMDEGITVKGSLSTQQFSETYTGELENNSYVITLQLRGVDSQDMEVAKPLTTREKLVCSTCGTSSNSDASFCKKCGTCLVSY